MWTGVFPAVTTKFTADDRLDHAEMERCFGLQMEAGCDGIIVCGSLGEGPMLSHDEKIEVLKTAQKVAGKKPVLLTVNEAGTREAASIARRAAKEGANGLMVVPSPIYHTNAEETVAALRAVAEAGDLPVMIYSNRLAYRVDVTVDQIAVTQPTNKVIIFTTDGQIWQQTDTTQINTYPKEGDTLEIRKEILGGYMCDVNKYQSVNCKRVK